GAGKSTALAICTGLLAPDSGSVRIGDAGSPREPAVRRLLGIAPQRLALYDALTARENLAFLGRIHGVERPMHRADALLDAVGLLPRARDRVSTFSGGMQRRLNLAAALVHSPPAIFLDEPTAGVDPSQRQRMWDFLYELCEGGTSLFVTTHYLDKAERCHTVGFMLGGRLIAQGSPATLRERLRHRLVGAEVQKVVEATRALRGLPGVSDVTIHGYELRVLFEEVVDWESAAGRLHEAAEHAGAPLRRVYPLEPTLEDLFIGYARGHARAA
ncbi:MAG: ATP-binding cassette domain-containing protein, partial [Alphaproteobacteria bacterium]